MPQHWGLMEPLLGENSKKGYTLPETPSCCALTRNGSCATAAESTAIRLARAITRPLGVLFCSGLTSNNGGVLRFGAKPVS